MTNYAKALAVASLIAALAAAGCASKDDGKVVIVKEKDADKKKHTKHEKGPNGGDVIDFGKYHAEIKVDHKNKEMNVYFLDGEAEKQVAVDAKDLTVVTNET